MEKFKNIIIDTDPAKLDLKFIHNFITNAYWANGRTFDEVKKCVSNSLNFGVYLNDKQIGYARIVTDYTGFAYLMDVFIDKKFRGNGYSKMLMDFIVNYPSIKNVKSWRLATKDAQKLYEKYGFKPLENPDIYMERKIEIE